MRTVAPVLPIREGRRRARSFGIVSTFPPTSCGIATFSAALAAGLIADGGSVDVVRCGVPVESDDVLVVGTIGGPSTAATRAAIDSLNANDCVIVQHEYGLYDGPDGESIIAVLDAIDVPTVVVAHTVLSEPTTHQRQVLQQVCRAADAVVVMTEMARRRLVEGFGVDPQKVTLIPHGAATPSSRTAPPVRQPDQPPRLLTWGLLGPGKGIEWAIDAFGELADLRPSPEYVIAGATHPKVRERQGELVPGHVAPTGRRVGHRGSGRVRRHLSRPDLAHPADSIRRSRGASLRLARSGHLRSPVAVAAGRPVVSTAFPHAVELLASGAGIIVPQRDPGALADAIRSVLTQPDLAASMAAEARRLSPDLSWAAVATVRGPDEPSRDAHRDPKLGRRMNPTCLPRPVAERPCRHLRRRQVRHPCDANTGIAPTTWLGSRS
ncbi:MAG: glycosyltransferase [Ilumatobacteraceae bacterium]